MQAVKSVCCAHTPPPAPPSPTSRHVQSRHCRDARVYGYTTTAMHEIEYISPIEYTHPPSFFLIATPMYNVTRIYCVCLRALSSDFQFHFSFVSEVYMRLSSYASFDGVRFSRIYPTGDNKTPPAPYARPPHKRFFVRCSSPFMRLAEHLKALRARCKQCLLGR